MIKYISWHQDLQSSEEVKTEKIKSTSCLGDGRGLIRMSRMSKNKITKTLGKRRNGRRSNRITVFKLLLSLLQFVRTDLVQDYSTIDEDGWNRRNKKRETRRYRKKYY